MKSRWITQRVQLMISQTEDDVRNYDRLVENSDNSWVTDNFAPRSNIGGVEVEDNVNEEYHINYWVDHK